MQFFSIYLYTEHFSKNIDSFSSRIELQSNVVRRGNVFLSYLFLALSLKRIRRQNYLSDQSNSIGLSQ